jgi:protein-disulfide isomerase
MPFAFHPNAELLAQAVVAADVQDGFWALHDALMTHDETLDAPTLDALAETVGLDLDALHADMASDLTQAVIAEDEAVLQQLINQTLTPAFFINGRRVDGNQDLAVFELHVAQEAAATQALLDQGLTLCEAYAERLDENLE